MLLLRVFRFVLDASREVRYSRAVLGVVIAAGLISGFATTGLIALINRTLTGEGFESASPLVVFGALCLGLPLFRFASQALLVKLTQETLYRLRLGWCRRIPTTPIRDLEQLGAHRLVASLTNDLGAITDALQTVPLVIMHAGVIFTCLVYLGWLSPLLLGLLLGFLVVGVVSYQLPVARAYVYARRARETWDAMMRHVQAVTFGAKELKMHRRRRQAMLDRQIEPTARAMRRSMTAGTYIFSAASAGGQVLFCVAIGLVLFVVPRFQPAPPEVLLGYSMTLIAMMTPLETILNALPRMTNAGVAIQKINELGLALMGTPGEPE